MLPHDVEHLLDHILRLVVSGELLLMCLKLFEQFLLIDLIDSTDSVYRLLCIFPSLARAHTNLGSVGKPYSPIIILGELGSHPQNFMIVKFLNIVAHLVTLLKTVGIVITCSSQVAISSKCSIVVDDLCIQVIHVNWSIKLDDYRSAATQLGLDISLDVDD